MKQGRGRPQQKMRPKQASLDLSFLRKGYYDEHNNLRPEILDEKARELAKHFGPRGGFDKVSSSQMRRFFGDVRELEEALEQKEVTFDSANEEELLGHLAMIKLLKSKLAYAKGRGNISAAFAKTLTEAIDQIKTPRDFRAFVLFFESIMGFYYGEGGGRIR